MNDNDIKHLEWCCGRLAMEDGHNVDFVLKFKEIIAEEKSNNRDRPISVAAARSRNDMNIAADLQKLNETHIPLVYMSEQGNLYYWGKTGFFKIGTIHDVLIPYLSTNRPVIIEVLHRRQQGEICEAKISTDGVIGIFINKGIAFKDFTVASITTRIMLDSLKEKS